ncbi:hypothetical protein AB0G06_39075 [Nonomuraea dietziae]|uniref:hypothetical protein n=1 Tax=Nonomuraea dietziae TaxID=65515 RepID=UPI0033D0FE38
MAIKDGDKVIASSSTPALYDAAFPHARQPGNNVSDGKAGTKTNGEKARAYLRILLAPHGTSTDTKRHYLRTTSWLSAR